MPLKTTSVTSVIRYGRALNSSEGRVLRLSILMMFTARAEEAPKRKLEPKIPRGSQRPKDTAARAMNPLPFMVFSVY